MTQNEKGKVRITTAVSDHCDQAEDGHPSTCLKIVEEIFSDISWKLVTQENDRCIFEAYVDPSIAAAFK